MNRIFVFSLIIAVSTLLVVGCGNGEEKVSLNAAAAMDQQTNPEVGPAIENSAAKSANQESKSINPATAEVREIGSMTAYSGVGSFHANNELFISSKVGGSLVALNFDKGDTIRKGQISAKVDPENFELMLESAEAQLKVAEANLNLAQTEFDRKKKLREDGAIPKATFDAVATQLDLAIAQKQAVEVSIKQAEKALRDAVTESPISGVVSHRHVSVGEFIGAGDPLLTVSVLNPLKLVFSVPERLATRIADGTEVEIRLAAYPGQTFKGIVSLIGPMVNQQTRSVPIEAEFKNNDGALRPGFFAEVIVPLNGSQRQFRVSVNALQKLDEGYVLNSVTDGRQIPVGVISMDSSEAIVTGDLTDGMAVKVIQ